MNLYYLRYFVTLAQMKHYTRAAEALSISQPSLSHAIAQMEEELGVPLFEKVGRNTRLTRFGEEFLACAEQTLATLDAGVDSLRRTARGEGLIRLGLLPVVGASYLPRLAADFLRERPGRALDFTFHAGMTPQLLDGLRTRQYDLVFCSQPPEDSGLTAVPFFRRNLVLITPKDHPLAARGAIDLAETTPYPQVFFAPRAGMRAVVDGLFAQAGVQPRIAYETEEVLVIAGLVAQGFGIAVVPYTDMIAALGVQVLPIRAPVCEQVFYMVHDEQLFLPPAAQEFRAFVLARGLQPPEDAALCSFH